MDFSGITFCAENKKRFRFQAFPLMSSGSLIHQPNMGIHKSGEIPFVELTGHKLEDPVHPFEMTDLNLAKGCFNIAGKIHNFANSSKQFMKSEHFFPKREMYNQQFPPIPFSQLVGGFVGSKSQLGSSSRESCQIWDIIFDKLAEFCGTSQSVCHSMFPNKQSQNYYSFENHLSQEILGSFCQQGVPSVDESHIIIKNTTNIMPEKIKHTHQAVSPAGVTIPNVKPITREGTDETDRSCSPVSKQSYAEVAKSFAVINQNKKTVTNSSSMQKKRNCGARDRAKYNSKPFNSAINNWRYHCNPLPADNRNQVKLSFRNKNKPNYYKCKNSSANFKTEAKTENNRCRPETRSQRVACKEEKYMKNNVQTVFKPCPVESREVSVDCPRVVCTDKDSSRTRDRRQESFAASCGVQSERSPAFSSDDPLPLVVDVVTTISNVQTSPTGSSESSPRGRYSSECSTDSEDSFVIFESNVECDAVIVALVRASSTSDSDLSEDGVVCQISDDDEDDDDDTETVVGLEEVNERWQRSFSDYPSCEKTPEKVQFADASTVHPMIAWNYAYRAARCGPWEQMARDRERFKFRIKRTESILDPVLSPDHRRRVWKKRVTDSSQVS